MKTLFEQLNNIPRTGCKDMWNAFMVEGAEFSAENDIPICPSSEIIPNALIGYDDAKNIYKRSHKTEPDFLVDAFVHFYLDDDKFDGKQSSIWLYPYKALEVLRHFAGVITADFSINQDFPEPWKIFNIYRMRCMGYWLYKQGISIINNVRWGSEETWKYCFDGIPYHSIVCIGTSASGLNLRINRPLFEEGLNEMIRRINPRVIITYGSSNYTFFKKVEDSGISVISFPSKTATAFSKEVNA